MAQNLFEELQTKKKGLAALAEKADEYGWIAAERKDEIINKLENDVLTIGVIGQMKCGKSTFLNAFVFKDDVLPAATTPMTAALSVITYGENKKVVAEFYTKAEWEEQKMMASRSLADVGGNSLEESKIKAAKELVKNADKLGAALESYLGKTQEDDFSNIIEYVGATGKYVPITKAVTIYWPEEYLKGVEIVDTPGFNDPIVSREERTKNFLQKADVVLVMLYAGRPFDATDRDILFKNVRQCGIGKVIIAINKYDLLLEKGNSEWIREYVREQIKKECKTCNDDSLVEILKQSDPITLSAEMALLAELPMDRIMADEIYKNHWNRYCDQILETGSQEEMGRMSHLDVLASAVKKMIDAEKEKILFAKPLNAIRAAAAERSAEIERSLIDCRGLIKNLSLTDEDLEEQLANLEKAEKRLNRKIESFGEDLKDIFRQVISSGKRELEDKVDEACKKMKKMVEDWGMLSKEEEIRLSLSEELQKLLTRTLKRSVENLSKDIKGKVKAQVRDFIGDVDEILMRFVPDVDGETLTKSISNKIQFNINKEDFCLGPDSESESEGEGGGVLEYIGSFIKGATLGLSAVAYRLASHGDVKRDLIGTINSISGDFDPREYLESILQKEEEITNLLKENFVVNLIDPMKQQIEELRSKDVSREEALEKENEREKELLKAKTETESQMAEVESFIKNQFVF